MTGPSKNYLAFIGDLVGSRSMPPEERVKVQKRFHSGEPMRDSIIDSLFLALAVIKSHWTDKQTKILTLLEKGKTSTEVEKLLNIPLSNISRTVDKTHFREFEYLRNNLVSVVQNGLYTQT